MTEQLACSVIIPVYNGEKYLDEAIASAVRQTIKNIEILVVDDCSTDCTAQIINNWVKKDPRVKYLSTFTNKGVAKARNTGVQEAKSEWIAFLDADDIWEPDKLALQFACQRANDAKLIYSAARCIDENGQPNGNYFLVPTTIDLQTILGGNDIICSSVLITRSLMISFPMSHANAHEDYITWISILKTGLIAYGVTEALVNYRISSTSKSGNKRHSALMTWRSYGYAGIPFFIKIGSFCRYAIHGLKRYGFNRNK
jgi:teichuronic acid biosynthesis glycosyltransferase TuaG